MVAAAPGYPGYSRNAPRQAEASVRSEPSLRNSAAVGRESAGRAQDTILSTSQDAWPYLDAAAPFAVDAAAPVSVSRSGDGGFQWLGGVQVPTAPGEAPSETSAGHARASSSFAAVRFLSLDRFRMPIMSPPIIVPLSVL